MGFDDVLIPPAGLIPRPSGRGMLIFLFESVPKYQILEQLP
jgi:hypothetical protein